MWFFICLILFFTLGPFLIVKIKGDSKNYLGYGVPILLVLISLKYFYSSIYYSIYNTCYGYGGFLDFCGWDFFGGIFLLILAIFFTIIYWSLLQKVVVKKDSKLVMRILLYLIIFVFLLIYIIFFRK